MAMFVDANTVTEVLQETQLAAEALGIKLQSIKIGGSDPDLERAFSTANESARRCAEYPTEPHSRASQKASGGAGGKESSPGDVLP